MSEQSRREVAYHEAGHAVVAVLHEVPFEYVRIAPASYYDPTLGWYENFLFGETNGQVHGTPAPWEFDHEIGNHEACRRLALVVLAGPEASHVHHGSRSMIRSGDGKQARQLAHMMAPGRVGMSDLWALAQTDVELAERQTNKLVDKAARSIFRECQHDVRAVLTEHWHLVEAVANALIERGTLKRDQVEEIVGPARLVKLAEELEGS